MKMKKREFVSRSCLQLGRKIIVPIHSTTSMALTKNKEATCNKIHYNNTGESEAALSK